SAPAATPTPVRRHRRLLRFAIAAGVTGLTAVTVAALRHGRPEPDSVHGSAAPEQRTSSGAPAASREDAPREGEPPTVGPSVHSDGNAAPTAPADRPAESAHPRAAVASVAPRRAAPATAPTPTASASARAKDQAVERSLFDRRD